MPSTRSSWRPTSEGVSTRKVDDLVTALGGTGISRSEVSRIVASLDEELAGFRTRRLDHLEFPYLFADATYVKGRLEHQVVSRAVVTITGVNATGDREVLGVAVGDGQTESFSPECARELRDRGLSGVRLVSSDAHRGLTNAIARCFIGASWQRCRVQRARCAQPHSEGELRRWSWPQIRTIFAQPSPGAVRTQYDQVIDSLAAKLPAVAAMLAEAKEEVCTFTHFPEAHWRKIWSTNPLERVNHEIKRRTNVVGVFPNDAALLRLVTAVVLEQHEEWAVAERHYLSQESMAELGTATSDDDTAGTSETPRPPGAPPVLPSPAEEEPAVVG
nr:IS256 family transposase [Acidimicrobium ferrooxidans]